MILSITGFMGCGKISVGRKLSQLLCCPFMDLDEMIEDEAGKSIPEIFAEVGERGFRQMELTVLSSVLSVKTEEGEDRATRGTKAGGPQAKRSGGVSEANVRTPSVHQTERSLMHLSPSDGTPPHHLLQKLPEYSFLPSPQ